MGKGLWDFAKEHSWEGEEPELAPMPDPDDTENMGNDVEAAARRNRENAEGEVLKEKILQQLKRGDFPEFILSTAIQAVGLLSHDLAFTETARQSLDEIYGDLGQQTLYADSAAVALERLREREKQFCSVLKRHIQPRYEQYNEIVDLMTDTLEAVEKLEQIQVVEEYLKN